MIPKESTLKKEFSKRDVQRMRNLITNKLKSRQDTKNKMKIIKKVMSGKKAVSLGL